MIVFLAKNGRRSTLAATPLQFYADAVLSSSALFSTTLGRAVHPEHIVITIRAHDMACKTGLLVVLASLGLVQGLSGRQDSDAASTACDLIEQAMSSSGSAGTVRSSICMKISKPCRMTLDLPRRCV